MNPITVFVVIFSLLVLTYISVAEQPRAKGQFVQAGMICLYPTNGVSVYSHDGTLSLDTVYLQSEYPVLFQVIGTDYNDASKGDDPLTQFRTPPASDFPALPGNAEWRIRF